MSPSKPLLLRIPAPTPLSIIKKLASVVFWILSFSYFLGSLTCRLVPFTLRLSSFVSKLLVPAFDCLFLCPPCRDEVRHPIPCFIIACIRCSCFLDIISSRLQIRILKPARRTNHNFRNSVLNTVQVSKYPSRLYQITASIP